MSRVASALPVPLLGGRGDPPAVEAAWAQVVTALGLYRRPGFRAQDVMRVHA